MADRERAKRAVNARMRNKASTSSTSSSNSNYSAGSGSKIDLPKITDFNQLPEINTQINNGVTFDSNSKNVTVAIPNAPNVDVNSIAGYSKFPELAVIEDITKPGIKNKCDERSFNAAKLEYEGGIRYEQLVQLHNKYVAERWKSLTEAYRSYSQGLIAVWELEKVKQQFLEVAKQQNITQEKGIQYVEQAHKTAISQARLPYSVAGQEAELSKAKSKAQKSFYEAKKADSEVNDFIKQLDETIDTTRK